MCEQRNSLREGEATRPPPPPPPCGVNDLWARYSSRAHNTGALAVAHTRSAVPPGAWRALPACWVPGAALYHPRHRHRLGVWGGSAAEHHSSHVSAGWHCYEFTGGHDCTATARHSLYSPLTLTTDDANSRGGVVTRGTQPCVRSGHVAEVNDPSVSDNAARGLPCCQCPQHLLSGVQERRAWRGRRVAAAC